MKQQKGFTLIELIISVFILSVAILGVYGAFSAMVVLTNNLSDSFTATYLAQEGVEIVRNIRDNNPSSNWNYGLTGYGSASGGCEADYTTSTNVSGAFAISHWPSGGDYLKMDLNGFYSYNPTGTPTKFKRQIVVDCLAADGSLDGSCLSTDYIMKVSVTVFWDQKASILNSGGLAGQTGSGSVTVKEYLYDWQ